LPASSCAASTRRLLGGYAGAIVADVHAVYDHLYEDKGGKATEAECWSHMRK
jgi:hypothetical protein